MGSFDIGSFLTGVSGGIARDREAKFLRGLEEKARQEELTRQEARETRAESRFLAGLGLEGITATSDTQPVLELLKAAGLDSPTQISGSEAIVSGRQQKAIDLEAKKQEQEQGQIASSLISSLGQFAGKDGFDAIFQRVSGLPLDENQLTQVRAAQESHIGLLEDEKQTIETRIARSGGTAEDARVELTRKGLPAEAVPYFMAERGALERSAADSQAIAAAKDYKGRFERVHSAIVKDRKSYEQAVGQFGGNFNAPDTAFLRQAEQATVEYTPQQEAEALEAGFQQVEIAHGDNAALADPKVVEQFGPTSDIVLYTESEELTEPQARKAYARWQLSLSDGPRMVQAFKLNNLPLTDARAYSDVRANFVKQSNILQGHGGLVLSYQEGETSLKDAVAGSQAIRADLEGMIEEFHRDEFKYSVKRGINLSDTLPLMQAIQDFLDTELTEFELILKQESEDVQARGIKSLESVINPAIGLRAQ